VDQLDAAFTALADPTRRAIVTRLARGDATVNELAAPFDMTLPAISKHLKVLERCGLISRTRRAQFRPCHLERQALDAAMSWIEENRRIWAQRFDKLDAHLRDIQRAPAQGGSAPPGAASHGTSRPPETASSGSNSPSGSGSPGGTSPSGGGFPGRERNDP
jgi:DNA-binding transcriptional ArsR family regulator